MSSPSITLLAVTIVALSLASVITNGVVAAANDDARPMSSASRSFAEAYDGAYSSADGDALRLSAASTLAYPDALCNISKDYHTSFVDTNADATYFFSTSFCEASSLTAQNVPWKNCTPPAQFRIFRAAGTSPATTKDDICGDLLFDNSSVLSVSGDSASVVLAFFNGASMAGAAQPPSLTLRISCVAASTLANSNPSSFVVTNVSTFEKNATTGAVEKIVVEARAPCYVNDNNSEEPKSKTGFYVALSLVMTFVVIFASVLVRAKMAGDRLRELKKIRGERAYLG